MLQVRAGVRDVAKAMEYLQTATSFGLLPQDASKRVQLVQVDITDPDSIGPAIGGASKVTPQSATLVTQRAGADHATGGASHGRDIEAVLRLTSCHIMPKSMLPD